MPGQKITTAFKNEDLLKYPQERAPLKDGEELTVGDLHGNALKLLWILLYHGLINISEADYNRFVEIYKIESLSADDIKSFKDLVARIEVNNNNVLVRLIGDVFCDRGSNDFFTATLLGHINNNKIKSEILFSNHDAEFLRSLAQYDNEVKNNQILTSASSFSDVLNSSIEGASRSLFMLKDNLYSGVINEENFNEFEKIIREKYLPQLKLVSYTLSDDGSITVYTHAPCGMTVIKSAAKKLGTEFKNTNSQELAESIDRLNAAFSLYITGQKGCSLFELGDPVSSLGIDGYPTDSNAPYASKGLFIRYAFTNSPFSFLAWSRLSAQNPILNIEPNIRFVFGHDIIHQIDLASLEPAEREKYEAHLFNIDNFFGKEGAPNIGSEYSYYQETRELKLESEAKRSEPNPTPATQGKDSTFPLAPISALSEKSN